MIEIKNLIKRYKYNKVIDNITMTLPDYGLVAIIGPSGSGKSTLLHIIGGIDKKFQGSVYVDNKPVSSFFKFKNIGFLFQNFHLITWLNAQQNIQLPLYYKNRKYILDDQTIDIRKSYEQKIFELSLGQRQRIAFLRTMIFNPRIILCDEPTASLDEKNSIEIMKLLKEESKNRLVVFVSHDLKLVEEYSDEIYVLEDGKIEHHVVKNKIKNNKKIDEEKCLKKKKIQLSILSMKQHKSRMIQLSISLIISFLSILLSLSLSESFHQQLSSYINTMIPQSSISFRLKKHNSMNIYDFNNESIIKHIHYYPEEYELLGIGEVKEKYTKGDSVEIYDDSGYIKQTDLLYGRVMMDYNEIVISKNVAMRFVKGNNINDLLDKEVMIWFKYHNEVKGKKVKIVGISYNNIESLYYFGNHFQIIKEIYNVDTIITHYGILYVDDVKNDLDILSNKYKHYEFRQVGKNTQEQIDLFMNKAKIVLFVFSMFATLSSVFLIGEVMFLEVMMKRKEIAIMKCFGANCIDIALFILYQFFIVFFISVGISISVFIGLCYVINNVLISELLTPINMLVLDYRIITKVTLFTFLFCLIAMIIPLIYAMKLNTVESLKIKS